MSTLLKLSLVLAFAIASIAASSPAFASGWAWDRDAGAKARGDYSPTPSQNGHNATTYRFSTAVCEFGNSSPSSYQPLAQTPLHRGDKVVVNVEAASLMIGDQTVATITKGQQLTVLKIQGPWVGASVRLGSQEKKGWIQESELVGLANQTEMRRCAFCQK